MINNINKIIFIVIIAGRLVPFSQISAFVLRKNLAGTAQSIAIAKYHFYFLMADLLLLPICHQDSNDIKSHVIIHTRDVEMTALR